MPFEERAEYRIEEAERLVAAARQLAGVACRRCGGLGWRIYGSTSTWHGGMGGSSPTAGICDECWGTGRSDQTGIDQRKVRRQLEDARRTSGKEYLAKRLGVEYKTMKEHLPAVADKLDRARWGDKFWLSRAADIVTDVLRELCEDAPA